MKNIKNRKNLFLIKTYEDFYKKNDNFSDFRKYKFLSKKLTKEFSTDQIIQLLNYYSDSKKNIDLYEKLIAIICELEYEDYFEFTPILKKKYKNASLFIKERIIDSIYLNTVDNIFFNEVIDDLNKLTDINFRIIIIERFTFLEKKSEKMDKAVLTIFNSRTEDILKIACMEYFANRNNSSVIGNILKLYNKSKNILLKRWVILSLMIYLKNGYKLDDEIKIFFFNKYRYTRNPLIKSEAAWACYQITFNIKYILYILKMYEEKKLYSEFSICAFKDFTFNKKTRNQIKKNISTEQFDLFYPKKI